jgi:hypothetical protein
VGPSSYSCLTSCRRRSVFCSLLQTDFPSALGVTRFSSMGLMAIVISSCAMLDARAPEEVVSDLTVQRVRLLMEGDAEASYEMTTPGYRSLEPANRYAIRWAGTGMWKAVDVESVSCEPPETPTYCKVTLLVTFQAFNSEPQSTRLFEDWVYLDHNWYYKQKLL